MKKYITFFSLIALFFIGLQQTQAQERKTLDESQGKAKQVEMNEIANKEKQQSPEHKAKVAQLEMIDAEAKAKFQMAALQEYVSDLSPDQESAVRKTFVELNQNLAQFEKEDKSKKVEDSKATLNEDTNSKIKQILNEKQLVAFNEYLASIDSTDE